MPKQENIGLKQLPKKRIPQDLIHTFNARAYPFHKRHFTVKRRNSVPESAIRIHTFPSHPKEWTCPKLNFTVDLCAAAVRILKFYTKIKYGTEGATLAKAGNTLAVDRYKAFLHFKAHIQTNLIGLYLMILNVFG
jgi:hypothetical protein